MSFYVYPWELAKFEERQRERITEMANAFKIPGMTFNNFEVALYHLETKQFKLRFKPLEQLLELVPVFNSAIAKMPIQVYVRPNQSSIILVDDLQIETTHEMTKDGFEPCVVVETSPDNFQAWVRVSYQMINANVSTEISRYLANKYNADLGSAKHRHVGRLVGYPNLKFAYEVDGKYPFTRLVFTKNQVATSGADLVAEVEKNVNAPGYKSSYKRGKKIHTLEETSRLFADIKCLRGSRFTPNSSSCGATAERCYTEMQKKETSTAKKHTNKKSFDYSDIDFAVASKLVFLGYDYDSIIEAIEKYSPDFKSRKSGHIDDYLQRTVSNAAKKVKASLENKPHTN